MSRKGNWVCADCVRRPRQDAPEPTDDTELTGRTTKPPKTAPPPEPPSPPPSEYSYEYYTEGEEVAPPPEPKKAKTKTDEAPSKTTRASPRERAQAVVDGTRDALAKALREAQAAENMFRDHFGDEPGPTGARSSGLRRDADGREIPDDQAPRSRARSPRKAPRTKRDRSPPEPPRRSQRPPEPKEPPRRSRPSDDWSEGKGEDGFWSWSEAWGYVWVDLKGKGKTKNKGKGHDKGARKGKTKGKRPFRPNSAERTGRAKGKMKGKGRKGKRSGPEEYPPDHPGEEDDDGGPGQAERDRRERRHADGDDDEDDGGDDDDPDDWWPYGYEEHAESERPTIDPSIEPSIAASEVCSAPGGQAPAPAGYVTAQAAAQPVDKPTSERSSHPSWDERKGPAPGIRWRGGKPPEPPAYEHQPRDLRSFPRWERRIRLWQKRVLMWLTPGEAALLLLESLTGQAELETEHLEIERVAQPDGIDYLLSELRKPLGEKTLYLKRLYLQEWETVGRQLNESIRSYVNRFRRILMDLRSREVGLETAFASETIGFRLLERAKLSPDQQRIVLVGSNQSFNYEAIRESMIMQFPEGKAPPPLYGVSAPKGQGKNQPQSYKGRNGKHDTRPRMVNVAEDHDEEKVEDPEEDVPEWDDDEASQEESQTVAELADQLQETLTVTADKLKALTQARRYSNPAPSGKPPKGKQKGSSSGDGKCHICGKLGHFARDCPQKQPGKGKGFGSSKVMLTNEADHDEDEENQESFFVYMNETADDQVSVIGLAPDVLANLTTAHTSAGYMILDTACQKLCHGTAWLEEHAKLLAEHAWWSTKEPTREKFKFGAGPVQTATERALIPCALKDELVVLRSCELQASIPLLGSLSLLTYLGAIIDLLQGEVFFKTLGVAVPLVRLANRHVAVGILPTSRKQAAQCLPDAFHWSPTTDELAGPPGRADKKGAPRSEPQVFHLEADEGDVGPDEGSFGIEREYDFSPFSSDAPEVYKAWLSNGPQRQSRRMEVHSASAPPADSGCPPSWETSAPASRPRDGAAAPQSRHAAPEVLRTSAGSHGSRHPLRSGRREPMPPRAGDEVRQQARPLRPVPEPGVRAQNAVRRSPGSVARVLLTIATALATSFAGTSGPAFAEADQDLWWPWLYGQDQSQEQDTTPPPGVRFDLRGERDVRNRPDLAGAPRRGVLRRGPLKSGKKKRLAGQTSNAVKLLLLEKGTLERELSQAHQRRQQSHFGVDLLEMPCDLHREAFHADHHRDRTVFTDFTEMFAGQAKPTHLAASYGLRAAEPAELRTGWDLRSPKGQRKWKAQIKELKPLVVVIQYPCRYWSLLTNTNYAHRPEELERLRKSEDGMFQLMLWTIREQTRQKRFWILENPQGSALWREPRVAQELTASNATAAIAESGAFGGTNTRGDPILKRYQFASNHEWLVEPLAKRLTPEERQQCVPLEGKDATASQVYPDRLAHAILQGIRRVARSHDPTRFEERKTQRRWSVACGEWDRAHTVSICQEVFYLDLNRDLTIWRQVLEQAKELFKTSTVRQITLSEGHEMHQRVAELVPWTDLKVQLARAPAARRLPYNFPYTHRAGVFLHNDDSLAIESEDVGNIAFPRQKFAKPVQLAIIIYGRAPPDERPREDPQAEVPQAEVRGAEIAFPDCSVPRDIKRAVARLHVNLGHPTSTDLVRMLVLHGSITPQALSAAKKLQCASCERMRQLPHTRPSRTVKYLGQLNDQVYMDLFYARDTKGENFTLIGAIDEATNLHQVRILPDRNPSTVVEAIRQMWVRPYGTPLRVTLDQDGSFQGETWEYLARLGVEVDYVPPEAHHRLGKIERNNSVFREVLNRAADAAAAVGWDEMEVAVDACVHAVNSVPRTRGMSPYACVFGQVPRIPGELLTDEHALAVDVDAHQHRLRSIVFRAEAQKAVADVNVDMHVRRALLRKTAHMRVDDITPGAKVAVWREQLRGRSSKKKGGYVIGRLITWHGTDHAPGSRSAGRRSR